MHDEHPHPLLAQVPLTVSPFIPLPTATTLPYTYKQLPSALPPSIVSPQPQSQQSDQHPNPQPAYIVSATGTTATPDAILTSCLALQSHLSSLEHSAKSTLREWEDRRRAADLAEKRRVAPGWLDGDVKLLVPESDAQQGGQDEDTAMGGQRGAEEAHGTPQQQRRTSVENKGLLESKDRPQDERERDDIDRAFGGLDIK